MKCLVLAEYDDKGLNKTTYSTITAAKQISDDVTVLVVGSGAEKIAAEVAKVGVKKVLVNNAEVYNFGKAESISMILAEIGKAFTHILASATSYGKNIIPRTAALLDVAQISDIIEVVDSETFKRPIYAGNAIATVKSKDAIKILTVRYTAFKEAEFQEAAAPIEKLTQVFDHPHAHYVGMNLNISTRPELASAAIVVSGGRGLQNAENFKTLLNPLADKLHAAVGASRAAVDAGYVDNDYQVGQTGKVVAPQLYIAIGISGAIQHLAGMKDSKIIVAINKDPSAEMMRVADYALEGDLFKIVPELIEKL